MGSGSSKHEVTKEDKQRHQAIQTVLEKEKQLGSKYMKILLLGGPGSGKTTITKQMQILHSEGFKNGEDNHQYRAIIHTNVACAVRQLIRGAKDLGIDLSAIEEDVDSFKEFLINFEIGTQSLVIGSDVGQVIQRIWQSQPMQQCYSQRSQIDIFESTQHYLERIETICSSDYEPSEADIIRARMSTSGIHEIQFTYQELVVSMVDVGGQKSERRKWLHVFDDVQVVMYIADVSGYAKIIEDGGNMINSLQNSLVIFQETLNKKELENAKVILFLNKVDIFTETLVTHDLNKCFPDFEGPNQLEECQKFILDKFLATVDKDIYYYFTTAINTENVGFVFKACMDVLFTKTSATAGL